jgi:hypothetical protein
MIDSFPASAPTDSAAPALLLAWGLAGEVEDLCLGVKFAPGMAALDQFACKRSRTMQRIETVAVA